jgi:hypothetical protein
MGFCHVVCDDEILAFAKKAKALRKQCTRKRTTAGAFVWPEEADMLLVLGE